MKDYCLTHSYDADPPSTPDSLGFIIVDDEHKIIYCTIPKVSTTTWKRILADLRGLKGKVAVSISKVEHACAFEEHQPSVYISRSVNTCFHISN